MFCLVTVLLKVRAHPALDSWKKPAHRRGPTATAKSAAQFRARGKCAALAVWRLKLDTTKSASRDHNHLLHQLYQPTAAACINSTQHADSTQANPLLSSTSGLYCTPIDELAQLRKEAMLCPTCTDVQGWSCFVQCAALAQGISTADESS
jgi:hypothetical protein